MSPSKEEDGEEHVWGASELPKLEKPPSGGIVRTYKGAPSPVRRLQPEPITLCFLPFVYYSSDYEVVFQCGYYSIPVCDSFSSYPSGFGNNCCEETTELPAKTNC